MSAVSRLAKTSCRNLSTACGAGGVCLNIHTGSSKRWRQTVSSSVRRLKASMQNEKCVGQKCSFTASVQKQQHFLRQDFDIFLLQFLHDHVVAGSWVTQTDKYLWWNNTSSFTFSVRLLLRQGKCLLWKNPFSPVWCRLKDSTRFRKMSGSCSVGSEGSPSSTTPSRNSTKSAFKCSESRDYLN